MDLIKRFDKNPRSYEIALLIADRLNGQIENLYREGKLVGHFILNFVTPVLIMGNSLGYYTAKLVRVYAAYLKDGISLIAFTTNKKELKSIEQWCQDLSIQYTKVKVDRQVDEYCLTHKEIVPEDDPCPQSELLEEDKDCLIMYDYSFFETKLILHDDNHIGTLEELNFEWDDRYVDGGYII